MIYYSGIIIEIDYIKEWKDGMDDWLFDFLCLYKSNRKIIILIFRLWCLFGIIIRDIIVVRYSYLCLSFNFI